MYAYFFRLPEERLNGVIVPEEVPRRNFGKNPPEYFFRYAHGGISGRYSKKYFLEIPTRTRVCIIKRGILGRTPTLICLSSPPRGILPPIPCTLGTSCNGNGIRPSFPRNPCKGREPRTILGSSFVPPNGLGPRLVFAGGLPNVVRLA